MRIPRLKKVLGCVSLDKGGFVIGWLCAARSLFSMCAFTAMVSNLLTHAEKRKNIFDERLRVLISGKKVQRCFRVSDNLKTPRIQSGNSKSLMKFEICIHEFSLWKLGGF